MKILITMITLILVGCSRPETVLICGDHVCINKAEAKQYFEENLSIEVKIINMDKPKDINLVQLQTKVDRIQLGKHPQLKFLQFYQIYQTLFH